MLTDVKELIKSSFWGICNNLDEVRICATGVGIEINRRGRKGRRVRVYEPYSAVNFKF